MLTTEQRLRMLETPQTTFDLVIDTDAYNEIDDQFAISYALRAGPAASAGAVRRALS